MPTDSVCVRHVLHRHWFKDLAGPESLAAFLLALLEHHKARGLDMRIVFMSTNSGKAADVQVVRQALKKRDVKVRGWSWWVGE